MKCQFILYYLIWNLNVLNTTHFILPSIVVLIKKLNNLQKKSKKGNFWFNRNENKNKKKYKSLNINIPYGLNKNLFYLYQMSHCFFMILICTKEATYYQYPPQDFFLFFFPLHKTQRLNIHQLWPFYYHNIILNFFSCLMFFCENNLIFNLQNWKGFRKVVLVYDIASM